MRSLTISELFGENQQGVKLPPSPSPRLKFMNNFHPRKFSLKGQEMYKPFTVSKKNQPTNKIKLNKKELSYSKTNTHTCFFQINKIREEKILG